jgi:DNA-binding CsgD family transcriptional regulator
MKTTCKPLPPGLALVHEILDNVPACIYINEFFENDRSYELKNVWSNRFANNFIGFSRHEIDRLGNGFFKQILHPDDHEMIEFPVAESLLSLAKNQNHLHRLRPKNSDRYHWMYGSSVITGYFDNGLPRQFLNIAVEISNQIQTGDQLFSLLKEAHQLKNKYHVQGLTNRQKQIISLIAKGNKDKDIAGLLYISPATVKTHRNMLIKKLNLKNSATLAAFAVECGLY